VGILVCPPFSSLLASICLERIIASTDPPIPPIQTRNYSSLERNKLSYALQCNASADALQCYLSEDALKFNASNDALQ
jgi:hypothetical protein